MTCYVCNTEIDTQVGNFKNYFYLGRWDGSDRYFIVFHSECFISFGGQELYDEINKNIVPPLKKT